MLWIIFALLALPLLAALVAALIRASKLSININYNDDDNDVGYYGPPDGPDNVPREYF